ncbi:MAG: hypothetical protein ABJP91_15810 [Sneathiella sp.]
MIDNDKKIDGVLVFAALMIVGVLVFSFWQTFVNTANDGFWNSTFLQTSVIAVSVLFAFFGILLQINAAEKRMLKSIHEEKTGRNAVIEREIQRSLDLISNSLDLYNRGAHPGGPYCERHEGDPDHTTAFAVLLRDCKRSVERAFVWEQHPIYLNGLTKETVDVCFDIAEARRIVLRGAEAAIDKMNSHDGRIFLFDTPAAFSNAEGRIPNVVRNFHVFEVTINNYRLTLQRFRDAL